MARCLIMLILGGCLRFHFAMAIFVRMDQVNSDVVVTAGDKVNLRCSSNAESEATWYRDNRVLEPLGSKIRTMKQTLRFKRIELSDSGVYACLLETPTHFEWRNITVNVEEAFQADDYQDENAGIGKILGSLRPEEETNELELESQSLPETRSLHLDSDGDNEKGGNENAGEHNNTLPESAPLFNKTDEMHGSVVKPAGNMVRLRCPAVGNPRPNITWLKNNEEPKRILGSVIRNKWTLRLEDIVIQDSGNYTCIVCNYLGCINHTFKVEVIERFPHKPYINMDFPKNVTALINSTVTFKCPIVSDLEPYMQWVKVDEYPRDQNNTPKGTLLQVQFNNGNTGGGSWVLIVFQFNPLFVHSQ